MVEILYEKYFRTSISRFEFQPCLLSKKPVLYDVINGLNLQEVGNFTLCSTHCPVVLSAMLVTAYSNSHILFLVSTYNNVWYTVIKWKCRTKIRSFFLLLWQNLTSINVKYSSVPTGPKFLKDCTLSSLKLIVESALFVCKAYERTVWDIMNLLDLMLINFVCLGSRGTHTHTSTASLNYLHEVSLSTSDLGNSNYGDQLCPQVNTTLRVVLEIPFYNIRTSFGCTLPVVWWTPNVHVFR
jgi:hypothetical protein